MYPEGTTLCKTSQTEKDRCYIVPLSLIREIFKKKKKNYKLIKERSKTETGRGGLEEGGQEAQISNYKISKYQGCNEQHNEQS